MENKTSFLWEKYVMANSCDKRRIMQVSDEHTRRWILLASPSFNYPVVSRTYDLAWSSYITVDLGCGNTSHTEALVPFLLRPVTFSTDSSKASIKLSLDMKRLKPTKTAARGTTGRKVNLLVETEN